MRLPDGNVLMHDGLPYDPAKAHDYYIKTRKLKGRKPAAGKIIVKKPRVINYTITGSNGKKQTLTPQQLTQQKAYAAKRVATIKQNLSDLGVLLRDKLQKAKEAAATAAKPPTLAEKAKAARDAEAYRKAHPQVIANKAKTAASKAPASSSTSKPAAKTDTVESLKVDITKARADLKTAVAKQRELATAKKNG